MLVDRWADALDPAAAPACPQGCRVIQLGPDPLFAATPVRGFPCDLALAGDVAASLALLGEALEPPAPGGSALRGGQLAAAARRGQRRARLVAADGGGGPPMSPAFVSRRLARGAAGRRDPVLRAGLRPGGDGLRRARQLFRLSTFGRPGLGRCRRRSAPSSPIPDRTVVATVGDGSYLFANPPACHQVAEALDLPVLTVVLNNGMLECRRTRPHAWSTRDGHAARGNEMPLTSLQPAPDYAMLARASRGHGERVEEPEALPGAIARALEVVRRERRQALLDVVVRPA